MHAYSTTKLGGCPQSRDRGPVLAINRLLEFIIVSSCDGEEPGGLREGGRRTKQHLYLTNSLKAKPLALGGDNYSEGEN